MKITYRQIRQMGACDDGRQFFLEHFGDEAEINAENVSKVLELGGEIYLNWFLASTSSRHYSRFIVACKPLDLSYDAMRTQIARELDQRQFATGYKYYEEFDRLYLPYAMSYCQEQKIIMLHIFMEVVDESNNPALD